VNLDSIHLDILKELGNIGAGNAATSLSQLLNQRVDMSVPEVKLLKLRDAPYILGGPEIPVIGVTVLIEGDGEGQILLLFASDSAERLIRNIVAGFSPGDISNEIRDSVLLEVGNIVGSTFLNALSSFINLKLIPTVPASTYDMVGALIDNALAIEMAEDDIIIIIVTDFTVKGETIEGYMIFVPKPEFLSKIFNALGVSS
jgi:chemotaxis protein CheC